MSIYIGGTTTVSKNLWKINDALDTVESSVLVDTSSHKVVILATDSSENIYSATQFGASDSSIWKHDSSLNVVTGWGSSGEVDPAGGKIQGLSTLPDGKMALGDSAETRFYDADGAIEWSTSLSQSFSSVEIDPISRHIYTFYSSGGTEHVLKLSRFDGSTLLDRLPQPDPGTTCGGIKLDRTHDPAHEYFFGTRLTGGLISARNPDSTQNQYWNNVTNIIQPQTPTSTGIALDSNGNIYLAGARLTGGDGGDDYSVMKIDPDDGAILAKFDTGSAAYCIAIDGDDNIFVGGARSGSKCVWKLNTSLVEQDSLATSVVDVDVRSIVVPNPVSLISVPPVDRQAIKRLVAIANDQIWYESSAGTMSVISGSKGELDTADYLEAFALEQKVFVVNGANLKIADLVNVKLTHSALGTAHAHGDILTQTQVSGVVAFMVVDFTNAAKTATYGYAYYTLATAFDTSTAITGGGSGSGFTPTVVTNPPHVYDWTVYPGGSSGTMPNQAYLGCAYRGRAVISGNPEDPHQWYMFRQLNPYDLAYIANDAQTPVLGGNSNAGKVGDVVKALIPFNDDYLIFGCATSMWFLQGDPAYGGSIMSLTNYTGIFGGRAWTFDEVGNLYFFGTGGLFTVKRGSRLVENLSSKRLPKLLEDENAKPETHRVTLGFDKRRNGLVLAITVLATGANSNYWYDLQSDGMFPESYPNVCGVFSQLYYPAEDDTYSDLILGGQDGYLRIFKDSAKDDDSGASDTTISSDVLMPVQDMVPDDEDLQGKLTSMVIESGGGSSGGVFGDTDSITYDIHVAKGAEEVVEDVRDGATPLHTDSVTGVGRNKRIRKRARGKYLGIVLKNTTAASTWVLEKLSIKTKPAGRIR